MNLWTLEDWEKALMEENAILLYLYTPLCGTCMVASKMLNIVEAMKKDVLFGKMDLNYAPSLAKKYEIESVPCLLIFKDGLMIEKIYRFQSVPFLLDTINRRIL
jgi:thioredoxin-like negative regulator of GroEL